MTTEDKKLKYLKFKEELSEVAKENYVTSQMFQVMKLNSNLHNFEYAFEFKKPADEFLNILELGGTSVYNLKKSAESFELLVETKIIDGGKILKVTLGANSIAFTLFKDAIIIEETAKHYENNKTTLTIINLVNINGKTYFFSDSKGKEGYTSNINIEQETQYDDITNTEIYDTEASKLIYGDYNSIFISDGRKSSCKCSYTDFWDKSSEIYFTIMKKDNDILPIIKNAGKGLKFIDFLEWSNHRVYKKRLESDWEFSSSKTPKEYKLLSDYKKLEKNCKNILQESKLNITFNK